MKRRSFHPQKWIALGALLAPAYLAATTDFSVIRGNEWPHIYPILGEFILGAVEGAFAGVLFALILFVLKLPFTRSE